MKLKDKNSSQQFIQAVKFIQQSSHVNDPAQKGVLELILDTAPCIGASTLKNAEIATLSFEVLEPRTTTVEAINALVKIGLMSEFNLDEQGNANFKFVPAMLVAVHKLLLNKNFMAGTRQLSKPFPVLRVATVTAFKHLQDRHPNHFKTA